MRAFKILTVVTIYMSVCRGQTDTRLGLLATDLGVAPVPGVSIQSGVLQGRPGQQINGNLQNFGGGLFQGGGGNFPGGNFNPNGINGINGNIGNSGSIAGDGCWCHPSNQRCPPGSQRRESTGTRIANFDGGYCVNQQICCSADAKPNARPNPGPGPLGPIIPLPTQPTCGKRGLSSQSSNPLEAGFGEFPWMTVITGVNNEILGGGALISNNVVLTAAHKIHQRPLQSIKIRVGDHNIDTDRDHSQYRHVESSVRRIIIHPQFDKNNLHNDVALLFLSQPVNLNQQQFPHIGSVCLPEQGQLFSPQRCWVTGWGASAFTGGQYQSILKKVDVPIWDPFVCEQRLRSQPRLGDKFNLDKTSFLCAGGEPGKDACTGDGGAPLVCEGTKGRFAVVGLVAWGLECAKKDVPGVYVNVANYVNFIKRNTGI